MVFFVITIYDFFLCLYIFSCKRFSYSRWILLHNFKSTKINKFLEPPPNPAIYIYMIQVLNYIDKYFGNVICTSTCNKYFGYMTNMIPETICHIPFDEFCIIFCFSFFCKRIYKSKKVLTRHGQMLWRKWTSLLFGPKVVWYGRLFNEFSLLVFILIWDSCYFSFFGK